jgi:hypothetical protein
VNGIYYLYPIDAFREASETRSLYFDRDTHPNRWGHAVAARVLLGDLHRRLGLEYRIAEADRELLGAQRLSEGAIPVFEPDGRLKH